MSANIPHSARSLSSASTFGRVSALFLCAVIAAFALNYLVFSSTASASAPPTLTQPAASSSYNTIPVSFVIPEVAAVDSVKLTFTGAQTRVLTLVEPTPGETVTSSINPAVPSMSEIVKSISGGMSIPDGTYTVTLSYQDTALNPGASDSSIDVTTDTSTDPPAIIAPTTGSTVVGQFSLDFNIPETPQPGSIHLDLNGETDYELTLADVAAGTHLITFDPANVFASSDLTAISGGAPIAYGVYDISVDYRDLLGNPVSSSAVVTGVRIDPPPTPPSTPTPDAPAPVVSGLAGASALSTASKAAARAKAARNVCMEMDKSARRTKCLSRAKPIPPSFTFTSTGAGAVTLSFTATVRGYLVGGKCLPRKRRSTVAPKRCMVKVDELSLTTTAAAGTNKLQLTFAQWRKLLAGATTATATIGDSTSTFAFKVR